MLQKVTVPPGWRQELPDVDVELLEWDLREPLADPAGVVAVVPPYMQDLPAVASLAELPDLRVVQTLTAGYETVLPHLPPGVVLANAAGVHDASTAELTLGLILASLRGIDDAVADAADHAWRAERRTSLADRRVLLIGTGSVGTAIARRLEPFEVQLTRVGRSARDDDAGHVHAVDQLPSLLPEHEVVILIVPLSPDTVGMVDAAFLAAMPDDALLVNVARGPVVDTGALVEALRSKRIHAALDVVDPEPLPPDHPLWDCPNLLLTPHLGGNSTAFQPRALAMLRTQFARLAAGEPLINVVATGAD